MLRNSLAQSCTTFLTVVAVAGVVFLGLFFASIGMLQLPDEVRQIPKTLEVWNQSYQAAQNTPQVEVLDDGANPVWSNPIEQEYEPTIVVQVAVDEPDPTATPIPPLDPAVYRVETTERLRTFSGALKRWMEYNQTLSEDASRLGDPIWQEGMQSALSEVTTSANSLAGVGPAPQEYSGVDALLDSVSGEAGSLTEDYNQAMKTRDLAYLQAAGDDFTRLRAYLKQAVEEMVKLGWEL